MTSCGEVELDRLTGQAEQRDIGAVPCILERGADCRAISAHLEHRIGALAVERLAPARHPRLIAGIEHQVGLQLSGQLGAVGVGLLYRDRAGAVAAGDGDSEQADGPGTNDQHIAAADTDRRHGVHGVADWIEHRRVAIRHIAMNLPNVGRRDRNGLGKTARSVDADDLRLGAEMGAPGAALHAMPASDVAFARDTIALVEVADAGADGDDVADELMAHGQRRPHTPGRPRVPMVDVEVGAADAGVPDRDGDLTEAGRRRLGDLVVPDTALRAFFRDSEHVVDYLRAAMIDGRPQPSKDLPAYP